MIEKLSEGVLSLFTRTILLIHNLIQFYCVIVKFKNFYVYTLFFSGIICNFPYKDINGFDILIHSNVPNIKGYGSSASLQVAFFAFLEAAYGNKLCVKSVTFFYF